ncbi:MAG: PEP-CTERM sorting domain-containing protein [Acidobacteriaceae bacterium]|nr:PEP-CTERM sorting domain-containing protein [Acidobacteriaceae bacterium]
MPFDLGSPFQISVSANANASGTIPDIGAGFGTDGGVEVMCVGLLEPDGTTLVPFVVTPEPGSWALVMLGMGGSAAVILKRRCSHR